MKLYLSATTPMPPAAATVIARPSTGVSEARMLDPDAARENPAHPRPANGAAKQDRQ